MSVDSKYVKQWDNLTSVMMKGRRRQLSLCTAIVNAQTSQWSVICIAAVYVRSFFHHDVFYIIFLRRKVAYGGRVIRGNGLPLVRSFIRENFLYTSPGVISTVQATGNGRPLQHIIGHIAKFLFLNLNYLLLAVGFTCYDEKIFVYLNCRSNLSPECDNNKCQIFHCLLWVFSLLQVPLSLFSYSFITAARLP